MVVAYANLDYEAVAAATVAAAAATASIGAWMPV